MSVMNDPVDICCICGAVGEDGEFQGINETDFELLCPDCKDCRCRSCDFLRSKMKFDREDFFCRHRGCILDPDNKVCDHYERMQHSEYLQDEEYTEG